MFKKEIFIVRHGETEYNRKGIVQGSGIDSSLNNNGYRQAQSFFRYYSHLHFDKIFVSNLARTKQTVQPFLDLGFPFEVSEDIREISWGRFEGQPYSDELKSGYKQMTDHWSNGNYDFALPEGESLRELITRLQKFMDTYLSEPFERLFICTHGRTMRCLLCLLLDIPMRNMEKFNHDNTGLFKVGFSGSKFKLLEENNTEHLQILRSALS
jgi:broad specificity phosphatase PhoE